MREIDYTDDQRDRHPHDSCSEHRLTDPGSSVSRESTSYQPKTKSYFQEQEQGMGNGEDEVGKETQSGLVIAVRYL